MADDFEVVPIGTIEKLRKLTALRAEIDALKRQLLIANLAMKFTDHDIQAVRTVVCRLADDVRGG